MSASSGNAIATAPATMQPVTSSVLAVPALGGFTGSLSLPSGSAAAGAVPSISDSLTLPSGIPGLQAVGRRTQGGAQVAFTILLAFSNTVSLNGPLTLSLSFPSAAMAGQGWFLAFYDPDAGWKQPFIGPGTVSGSAVAFSGVFALNFAAGKTYLFAVYAAQSSTPTPVPSPSPVASATPTPTATPSPAPTATPTPVASASPTASPTASPAALTLSLASPVQFLGTGASFAQTLSASEANYTGAFTVAVGNCTGGGTLTALPLGRASWTITPVAAGTCTITVTDANSPSQSASVQAIVTVTTIGGT